MLELSYILIYITLIVLIFIGFKKAISKRKNINAFTATFIGANLLWLAYLYLISFNGFVSDRSLPPRFPIAVFIPLVVIIIFLLRWLQKEDLHRLIPKSWAIYYQTFRVIMEQVILFTALKEIIPMEATYKGYNFEFYFALSAPFVAYFAFKKKVLPDSFLILWNCLGILFLIIVVTIIASAFFAPDWWNYENQIVKDDFTKLPFILLPAFMVPSAIFMHLFSIIQIVKSKDTE